MILVVGTVAITDAAFVQCATLAAATWPARLASDLRRTSRPVLPDTKAKACKSIPKAPSPEIQNDLPAYPKL